MPLRNIKGLVEYDGTEFEGFQIQPESHRTVQGEIKRVLEGVLDHPVNVKGASRTDAGVHAAGQVVAFKTSASRTLTEVLNGANSCSDGDWQILELSEVDWKFHPRFDAKGKIYVYLIDRLNSVLRQRYSWGIVENLDLPVMREASRFITGEHDFKSFTTSRGNLGEITIRRIDDVKIIERKNLIEIEIKGSGFLYQMVRRIVATLVNVGKGELKKEDIEKLVEQPVFDSTKSVAPAKGLILNKVIY